MVFFDSCNSNMNLRLEQSCITPKLYTYTLHFPLNNIKELSHYIIYTIFIHICVYMGIYNGRDLVLCKGAQRGGMSKKDG